MTTNVTGYIIDTKHTNLNTVWIRNWQQHQSFIMSPRYGTQTHINWKKTKFKHYLKGLTDDSMIWFAWELSTLWVYNDAERHPQMYNNWNVIKITWLRANWSILEANLSYALNMRQSVCVRAHLHTSVKTQDAFLQDKLFAEKGLRALSQMAAYDKAS